MSFVNVDRIQMWIDKGRLDPSKPITLNELVKSRCIHGIKDGIKLMGNVWEHHVNKVARLTPGIECDEVQDTSRYCCITSIDQSHRSSRASRRISHNAILFQTSYQTNTTGRNEPHCFDRGNWWTS